MADTQPTIRFVTKLYRRVPNAKVAAKVIEIMKNPLYIAHQLLPDGPVTTTIVVVLRHA